MAEERITPVKKTIASTGTVPISDIIFSTLGHWPWILLSVAVCVSIAYVYQLRLPNIYTRCAEILIKDGKNDKVVGFDDFTGLETKTNLSNEVLTLKSYDLMEDVVKRLNLEFSYFYEGKFRNDVAYGIYLPFKVEMPDASAETACSFRVKSNKGNITISDLSAPGIAKSDKEYKGKYNTPIATPVGNIVIKPTAMYTPGENIEVLVNKSTLADATNSYVDRLNVEITNKETSIIYLSFPDQSAQRADDILTTLISVYNEHWIRDKNQIAESTTNFINDRINIIEHELGNVENDIFSYKSSHFIPDNVDALTGMYINQSQQSAQAILDVNNQLSTARHVRQSILNSANSNELLPSNLSFPGSDINGLIGQYNSAMLKRNQLIDKSSEKNPMVATLDNQIEQLRLLMVRSIDNAITTLNNQLKALQNSEAQAMSKMASNPSQAKYLLSAERQQKVKESLYLYLLQKREENELSQAFTAYNTRVVNRPGPSAFPPVPNRKNIMLIAFLIGLGIPFAVSFAVQMLNNKLRGRKDIEDLTPPFIGEIPQQESLVERKLFKRPVYKKGIVVKEGKRNTINEAFRVLRTNVDLMKIHKNEADVIAFTSFNPGSGKSFLTMNLGVALALKKQRVLIIDGDMRHATASSYIGRPESGMANFLAGKEEDVHSLIYSYENIPTLDVLPVGITPPNPTELLASKEFEKMLEELRKEYDYILIDCPPIEVVADTQIIDKLVDRTIFVLRVGLFDRSMLPQIEKIYAERRFKNMAILLNGTPTARGRYGYTYGYSYSYGYGYGYGYHYGSDKNENA